MNQNTCPTCGCELSNASFAEDGILCMWCGTINKIEGDPMPQPDDFLGPDPEERSLSSAHLEEQNSSRYEDRHGSWDDYDEPDDDGWDD